MQTECITRDKYNVSALIKIVVNAKNCIALIKLHFLFQAVLRKWRKLHLSNVPKKILSMTMALPLLPSDMFQEALLIIQTKADELSNEHPDILQFMSYLRLTWSNMASKISTYRCPVRTNNIVESFHNIAAQKLGTRNINVWTFLGNFYVKVFYIKYEILQCVRDYYIFLK